MESHPGANIPNISMEEAINQLQEIYAKNGQPLPQYEVILSKGPSHSPQFQMQVKCGNIKVDGEICSTKKDAKKSAAFHYLLRHHAHDFGLDSSSSQSMGPLVNYKNKLQEYFQKKQMVLPVYSVEQKGPSHTPRFRAKVLLKIREHGKDVEKEYQTDWDYKTSKHAEQGAAELAYQSMFVKKQENTPSKVSQESENNSDIPHTKTKPRDYQIEVYQEALEKNIICCLPTGCGKTLIACMLIAKMAKLHPNKKILFLVERLLLVTQQAQVIEEETGLNCYQLVGGQKFSLELFRHCHVLVATVGSFVNIQPPLFKEFSLIIIDEAHHSKKNHNFAFTIRAFNIAYKESQTKPKLFGMTASPSDTAGIRKKELDQIKELMNARIFFPTQFRESVFKHKNNSSNVFLQVSMSEEEQDFLTFLEDWLVEEQLVSSKGQCIQLFMDVKDILENFGLHAARTFLFNAEFGEIPRELFGSSSCNDDFQSLNYTKLIQDKCCKTHELLKYLKHHFQPNQKMIVFVKTKDSCTILKNVFERVKLNQIVVQTIMGKSEMSNAAQVETLRDFRDGKCNVLISTSVCEEGIDVSECDVVTRFDHPPTMISLIQSRGRARKANSKLICIHKTMDQRERFEDLQKKEEEMIKMIDQWAI